MKITFATFNIGSAAKRTAKYTEENLSDVAAAAKSSGADIICMQEVDRGCTRSDGVDMPAYISQNAGYPYYHFIKIRDFQGGQYGTLIISRHPLIESGTYNYPVKLAKWGTSAGMAVFNVNGKLFQVFNSHLSCENDEKNSETMHCFADYMKLRGGARYIAAADFNAYPDKVAREISFLGTANPGLPTYSTKAIDNILYTDGITVSGIRTVDTTSDGTSDHRMLLCEVEF